MKLTKTVLAVAIAGIAAVPMMASATTTLSGVVQIQLSGSDADGCNTNLAYVDADGAPDADAAAAAGCMLNKNGDPSDLGAAQITPGDVLFGIAASQALNSGLTGYGSLRLDMNQTSNEAPGTTDSVYVGVKGGFGDLRFGEVANPGEYGQFIDPKFDAGTGIDQGIGYEGSFGGATVGLSYSPSTDQDILAVGAKFAWNGLSIGAGMQDKDELVNYTAKVGFAYAGASINLGVQGMEAAVGDDETVINASVGYGIAGVKLGLEFQSADIAKTDVIRLNAVYDLGGGMDVSTRITSTDADGTDSTVWRVQLSKKF